MTLFVQYRSKIVSAEDSTETLKILESAVAGSFGESTVNVSVYWRILEL
jgi:hypothetical protein